MERMFFNIPNPKDLERIFSNDDRQSDLPELKIGDNNDDVLILKEKLKILGYYSAPVSKGFDSLTQKAVENFQNDNNITPTGIVDSTTWEILYEKTKPSFPMRAKSLTRPTLKLGSTGSDVEELQKQLTNLLYYEGPIDGIYSTETQSAVRKFQSINKLTVDGIVGTDTWSALFYLYSPLSICGTPEPGKTTHTVVSGDTLYSLAKKYNITVDEIKRLNNLTSNTLSIGQVLTIKEVKEPEGINTIHTVVSGDTLYSLAKKYNTTIDEIKKLNNLTSNTLSIGQKIIVKKVPTEEQPKNQYTVVSGDTLYSIAKKYNTTVDEIKKLNNLSSNTLRLGQILIVPGETTTNKIHVVKSGDTLYSLARLYNTTVDEIKRLNNLTTNILTIGTILYIPTI